MNLSVRGRIGRPYLEWLGLAVFLVALGFALALASYRDRVGIESLESERLQGQAHVINDNLIRQLSGASAALKAVRDRLHHQEPVYDPPAIDELKLLVGAMPGVSTMLILDASGKVTASSREELIGRNFRQRAYFDVPRRHPDTATLYLSPPFVSALGTYVVVATKVLVNDSGEFAGVVTATLDPEYFNVVLRSVLYAPDMRTTLIHGEGQVFLNTSTTSLDAKRTIDVRLSATDPTFADLRHSGRPAALVTGNIFASGGERMVALRRIVQTDLHIDEPLVVAVSRDTAAMYEPWQQRAIGLALFFVLLCGGSAIGLSLMQRRRLALAEIAAAVAREREAGAQRVEQALRGADLGLWDLHVPSNTLVVNDRERALLGFALDEKMPAGQSWRDLVHPDDRQAVDASILPHLRGEASSFESEYRMRHQDGRWVWLFSRAMIVERDAGGAPLRIVGTHLDVTARKLADAELARVAALLGDSEEQLRQVTDNMPALVSRLDAEQRFCFVNRAYRDWLHLEPEALIGRSLCEVYGEAAYATFGHHIEAALAGARVVYARALATPGGERQVEVILVPQFGADGSVQGLYTLMNDITARHLAEAQRARSEERLSLALEGSSLSLFDWDIGRGHLYHSAQAAAMRGDAAVETTTEAAAMQEYMHPDDLDGVLARLTEAVKGDSPVYNAEFRLRHRAGHWFWVRARGRVVERDADGKALRLAGTYADIDQRKIAEERLRHLAEFDTLTGLPNRFLFQDRLRQAMLRAARGQPMALMFLDIDHFKSVNDSLGHEAGDRLLTVYAERMQATVRESDTVARLAGDEFTIVLEGMGERAHAIRLAAKLVEALGQPMALAGRLLTVTASVGVAFSLPAESDDAALLRRADAALYEAKRRGRNGFFCDDTQAPGALVA